MTFHKRFVSNRLPINLVKIWRKKTRKHFTFLVCLRRLSQYVSEGEKFSRNCKNLIYVYIFPMECLNIRNQYKPTFIGKFVSNPKCIISVRCMYNTVCDCCTRIYWLVYLFYFSVIRSSITPLRQALMYVPDLNTLVTQIYTYFTVHLAIFFMDIEDFHQNYYI